MISVSIFNHNIYLNERETNKTFVQHCTQDEKNKHKQHWVRIRKFYLQ